MNKKLHISICDEKHKKSHNYIITTRKRIKKNNPNE